VLEEIARQLKPLEARAASRHAVVEELDEGRARVAQTLAEAEETM
jgi:hypothetical protein